MIGRFWCTARIISPAIRSRSAQTNGLITSGFPILSLTEAALSIVQRTQAIEQMLNAGWWPRLFFREQNPKPLSYFRTDGTDVVCIEVEGISARHCASPICNLPCRIHQAEGWESFREKSTKVNIGRVPQKEPTNGTTNHSMGWKGASTRLAIRTNQGRPGNGVQAYTGRTTFTGF